MKSYLFVCIFSIYYSLLSAQNQRFEDGLEIFCEYDSKVNITGKSSFGYNQVLSIDGEAYGYKNYRCGVKDHNGRIIIPSNYILIIRNGDIFELSTEKKSGLIHKSGKEITPCHYSYLHAMNNGFYQVEYARKMGVITHDGKEIIPCKYEMVSLNNDCFRVLKKDKWGILDMNGNTVIPCHYDILSWEDGLIEVMRKDKWGILDEYGNTIVPCEYDIINRKKEIIEVLKKDKWGVLDQRGCTIIPCKYDIITTISNELFRVQHNGYMGIINNHNETVVDFQYVYIGPFTNGVADACICDDLIELNSSTQIKNYKEKGYEEINNPYRLLVMGKNIRYEKIQLAAIQ